MGCFQIDSTSLRSYTLNIPNLFIVRSLGYRVSNYKTYHFLGVL